MENQFKITVGLNIQKYRKIAEMTQKQLADKIGLSEGNVSKYEAGNIKKVDIEMVMRIANALSCNPNDITGWKVENPKTSLLSEIASEKEKDDKLQMIIDCYNNSDELGKSIILEMALSSQKNHPNKKDAEKLAI